MGTRHLSMRMSEDTLSQLERTARSRHETKSALAGRLIEEGLRMQRHPAIVFRDGPSGRRPGLAGSGLDVWEVVRTVQPHGGDVEAAAGYLHKPAWLVQAAMDYYSEFQSEVDEWIAENDRLADEMQAAVKRRP